MTHCENESVACSRRQVKAAARLWIRNKKMIMIQRRISETCTGFLSRNNASQNLPRFLVVYPHNGSPMITASYSLEERKPKWLSHHKHGDPFFITGGGGGFFGMRGGRTWKAAHRCIGQNHLPPFFSSDFGHFILREWEKSKIKHKNRSFEICP